MNIIIGHETSDSRFCPIVLSILVLAASGPSAADIDIEVVRGYEGMARYAEEAAGKDEAERAILYRKFVGEPYRSKCYREIPGHSEARQRLTTPIDDIDALADSVRAITLNGVESLVTDAIRKSDRLLPGKRVTVCLFPYSPDGENADFVRKNMDGVMGFSEAYGILWIEAIPASGWLARLPYTTAHEYHHAVGFFSEEHPLQIQESLLATIISEGRADTFADLVVTGLPLLWTDTLSQNEEKRIWKEMQPYLDSKDEKTVLKYVFGSETEGIPQTAGYTIGYRIAQSYVTNNSKESPAQWSSIDPQSFLEKSGYGLDSTER